MRYNKSLIISPLHRFLHRDLQGEGTSRQLFPL